MNGATDRTFIEGKTWLATLKQTNPFFGITEWKTHINRATSEMSTAYHLWKTLHTPTMEFSEFNEYFNNTGHVLQVQVSCCSKNLLNCVS
jgi:hypothetical protein